MKAYQICRWLGRPALVLMLLSGGCSDGSGDSYLAGPMKPPPSLFLSLEHASNGTPFKPDELEVLWVTKVGNAAFAEYPCVCRNTAPFNGDSCFGGHELVGEDLDRTTYTYRMQLRFIFPSGVSYDIKLDLPGERSRETYVRIRLDEEVPPIIETPVIRDMCQ